MALVETLGGGGGGGSAADVKEEGSTVQAAASRLNFVGIGQTAASDGSGGATITSHLPAHSLYHPDTPPASPSLFSGVSYDLEFVRDATIGGSPTTLGSPATAPSIVDRALRIVGGTSASADVKGLEWACPSGNFTLTAKLRRHFHNTTFGNFGVMLRRNASGAGNFTSFWSNLLTSGYTSLSFGGDRYSAVTTRGTAGGTNALTSLLWMPYYVRWVYDGTNIKASLSFSGQEDTFFQVYTETAATNLGGAPGRFGIIMDSFGTTAITGYCEFVRFTP